MLTQIKLRSLFDLFDYDIDFTNKDHSSIKFITGPNGYGKTTILSFIFSLFLKQYDVFINTPFSFVSYFFNDNGDYHEVSITKEKKATEMDLFSDNTPSFSIMLHFAFCSIQNGISQEIEKFTLDSNGKLVDGWDNNTNMFMETKSCYFITDDRRRMIKTDVSDLNDEMQNLRIERYARDLKKRLNYSETPSETDAKVAVFKKIITRFHFVNKDLEISKMWGFRFIASDKYRTILKLNDLSSGERQIITQVYELIFLAQTGTLAMVDEPEISFHMLWQMNYLKTIREISKFRGFQCIIATHSPQIFDGRWNITVDLFDQTKTKDRKV